MGKKFKSSLFNLKDFRSDFDIKKQSDLEDILGVKQSFISRVENGRELLPSYCIEALADTYGDENVEKYIIEESTAKATLQASLNEGVPYYENIDVTGGIVTSFNDYKEIPTFYIDYRHFNDCTAYLPVVGDSMYPKYASGEIVAIKEIRNRDVILWGETYLVICNGDTDNLRTIKLLFPHEDSSKIILRASNPNYKGDTVIYKEDIIHLYIVKGKITRNQL